jgi:hypothetical protein
VDDERHRLHLARRQHVVLRRLSQRASDPLDSED